MVVFPHSLYTSKYVNATVRDVQLTRPDSNALHHCNSHQTTYQYNGVTNSSPTINQGSSTSCWDRTTQVVVSEGEINRLYQSMGVGQRQLKPSLFTVPRRRIKHLPFHSPSRIHCDVTRRILSYIPRLGPGQGRTLCPRIVGGGGFLHQPPNTGTVSESEKLTSPSDGVTKQRMCSQRNQAEGVFTAQPSRGRVHSATKQRSCSQRNQAEGVFTTQPSRGCVHNATKQRSCSQRNQAEVVFTAQPSRGCVHSAKSRGRVHSATKQRVCSQRNQAEGVFTTQPSRGVHSATKQRSCSQRNQAEGVFTAQKQRSCSQRNQAEVVFTAQPSRGCVHNATKQRVCSQRNQAEVVFTAQPSRGRVHSATKQRVCSQRNQAEGVFTAQPSRGRVHSATKQRSCSQRNQAEGVFTAQPSRGCVHNATKQMSCSQRNQAEGVFTTRNERAMIRSQIPDTYETTGKYSYRTDRQRTVVYEHVPSQVSCVLLPGPKRTKVSASKVSCVLLPGPKQPKFSASKVNCVLLPGPKTNKFLRLRLTARDREREVSLVTPTGQAGLAGFPGCHLDYGLSLAPSTGPLSTRGYGWPVRQVLAQSAADTEFFGHNTKPFAYELEES
ncbi:hypothetical protein J6590_064415 [Homalodisca vitripennis]|nr:hypothetical protein J6590_064415 [Homalodisca vitripennis]